MKPSSWLTTGVSGSPEKAGEPVTGSVVVFQVNILLFYESVFCLIIKVQAAATCRRTPQRVGWRRAALAGVDGVLPFSINGPARGSLISLPPAVFGG